MEVFMQPEFWHQRWSENQIGFHQDAPTPLLLKHWPSLGVAPGSQVFVPLAGKSLDMAWLASQGHRVLGVELSALAVEQFFDDQALQPDIRESKYGRHYSAGGIELICGDAFALDADALRGCAAVFDRAALIALPPELRVRYVRELYARLPSGCRGVLVTLEYPQEERAGPPFSVSEEEVIRLFSDGWEIARLERHPIPPRHSGYVAGTSVLDACAWQLGRTR
jgi:thiopurine S-methyltransferase